jgi:hypothetical protein
MTETIEEKILRFVASRPDGTTCPSEIARSIAKDNDAPFSWRRYMPSVHETVDSMIARGEITLTWKSSELSKRAGPYRIGARKADAADEAQAD